MRPGITWAGAVLASLLVATAAVAVAEAEPEEAADQEMAAETEGEDAETANATSPEPAGSVVRSAFTTGVEEREPVDQIRALSNDQEEVAYFTELRDLEGHTVVHRWEYGDQVVAEVPFEVDGPRWRVHSTKRLDPSWLGTWRVSVVADGRVLTSEELEYTAEDVTAATQDAPAGDAARSGDTGDEAAAASEASGAPSPPAGLDVQ